MGGHVNPAPPYLSCMVRPVPILVESVQPTACWCSLFTFCVGLRRRDQYIFGVSWGGSFSGFFFSAFILRVLVRRRTPNAGAA